MFDVFFSSYNSIIKISLNSDEYNTMLNDEFLYSYIPSLKILNVDQKSFDASIRVIKDFKNYIAFSYPNIEYHYIDFDSKDVISLIEYVFERARCEKGIICIHGAGAIINDSLIVSWGGATGMGKTSLALELSKYGEFYSDEKILIDLNRRYGVGRINRQYISNDYWRQKYNTTDKYIEFNNDLDEYKINLFIQPILCDSNDFVFDKWNSDKFMWHLYEESSRKIRGTSRMFFKNTYPAESLDTFEVSIKRLNLIKEFCKNITALYYKGNVDYIVDKIRVDY